MQFIHLSTIYFRIAKLFWDRCIVSITMALQIPFPGKCIIITVSSAPTASGRKFCSQHPFKTFRSENVNISFDQGLFTVIRKRHQQFFYFWDWEAVKKGNVLPFFWPIYNFFDHRNVIVPNGNFLLKIHNNCMFFSNLCHHFHKNNHSWWFSFVLLP